MSVVLEQISAEVAIYNDNFLLPSYELKFLDVTCLFENSQISNFFLTRAKPKSSSNTIF